MSVYYVNLVRSSAGCQETYSEPLALTARRKRIFRMADGRSLVRDVGVCILEAEGYTTKDEIVFAEPGDMHLLGIRTIV